MKKQSNHFMDTEKYKVITKDISDYIISKHLAPVEIFIILNSIEKQITIDMQMNAEMRILSSMKIKKNNALG